LTTIQDHIGDMTTFPPSTDLVIGPGFRKQYLPGYPTNKDSAMLDTDTQNRTVREIPESDFTLMLGRFPAFDYFGDGSFYLLHSPGHTVGHMCGLARTTPNTFVFMGGDAGHHGGEFRPTEFIPLPKDVQAAPLSRFGAGCPGAFLVEKIHPKSSGTEPFYDIAKGFSHDHDEAKRSIAKLQEFDASEDVLVCIAHDGTMLGNMDFYPKSCNDWKEKGVQKNIRWAFVGDFDLTAERPVAGGEDDFDYSWLSASKPPGGKK
jgi:glyoxylase-like metal-dependent hydrolase (beta-lactamase superfamily II)